MPPMYRSMGSFSRIGCSFGLVLADGGYASSMHRNGKPRTKEEEDAIRRASKLNYSYGILTYDTRRDAPRPFTAKMSRDIEN